MPSDKTLLNAEHGKKVNLPVILKTKYAFHALLWLGKPEVVLDIGSMDGSDSKRFRTLLPKAEIVAFEGNPYNYRAMLEDPQIERQRIRVENRLVSDTVGKRSFFVERPLAGARHFNRGTSSLTRRDQNGAATEEVCLEAESVESFLSRDYPRASSEALWGMSKDTPMRCCRASAARRNGSS